MSPKEKIAAMNKVFSKCLEIADAKGRDYSGDDGLGNFKTFGWKGIVVRLEDKMQRLIQFAKTGSFKVKDESVEDTLLDQINYACLCLIMYREEKNQAGPAATEKDFDSPIGACNDRVTIKKPVMDETSLRFKAMLDNVIIMQSGPIFPLRGGYTFKLKL